MMSRLFFFILILNRIHGEYLSNADSSSFIVLRHIRLLTDNEHYRIQCPYNLNYLTLQLLNYSNENCFNLYSTSNNNICRNHHSPCQFHTKSVRLHCHHHHHPSYSNHVDITYQCSYKSTISPSILHSDSSNPEENIALFLIGLGIVISFWIFICCIWFIHYHHHYEKCQSLSHRSYSKDDIIDFKNNPIMVDNLCLHINPFENNHISSLRTI